MTQECKVECYRDLYAMFKEKTEVEQLNYPETKKDYVFECVVNSMKVECIIRSGIDLLRIRATLLCPGKTLEEIKDLGEEIVKNHAGIYPIFYEGVLIFQYSFPFAGIADPDAKRLCLDNARTFLEFVISVEKNNESEIEHVDENLNQQNVDEDPTDENIEWVEQEKVESCEIKDPAAITEGLEKDSSSVSICPEEKNGMNNEYGIPDDCGPLFGNSNYDNASLNDSVVFDESKQKKESQINDSNNQSEKEDKKDFVNNGLEEKLHESKSENCEKNIQTNEDDITERENKLKKEREELTVERKKLERLAIELDNSKDKGKIEDLQKIIEQQKNEYATLEQQYNDLLDEKKDLERSTYEYNQSLLKDLEQLKNAHQSDVDHYLEVIKEKEANITELEESSCMLKNNFEEKERQIQSAFENEKKQYEEKINELLKENELLRVKSNNNVDSVSAKINENAIKEMEDAYELELQAILNVNEELNLKLHELNVQNSNSSDSLEQVKILTEKIAELENPQYEVLKIKEAMESTHENFVKTVGEGKNIYKAEVKGCTVTADLDNKMLYIKKDCKKPARYKNEIHKLNEQNIQELYYVAPEKIVCKKLLSMNFDKDMNSVISKLNQLF